MSRTESQRLKVKRISKKNDCCQRQKLKKIVTKARWLQSLWCSPTQIEVHFKFCDTQKGANSDNCQYHHESQAVAPPSLNSSYKCSVSQASL